MKTYIVFVKKGAAATGLGTIKLKADDYETENSAHLAFSVGGKVIARFHAGEWVAVIEEAQLVSA